MSTRCTRCGGPVVEIVLTTDGRELTMRSCSHCDTREWASGDESVERDAVLGEITESSTGRRHRRST